MPPIPGEPLRVTESEIVRLEEEVESQLSDALNLHVDLEEEVEENRNLYFAEPDVPVRTFPWKGACNVVIPLIGTVMDSVLARIVNTVFDQEPFWSVRPLHKTFIEHAPRVEHFMEWSRKSEMVDFYQQIKAFVSGVCLDGTSWMKVPWEISPYAYYERNREGMPVRQIVDRRRPHPQCVLLTDMIVQPGVDCPEQAEWKAHRIRLTDTQMVWRNLRGMYQAKKGLDWDTILQTKEEVFDSSLYSKDERYSSRSTLSTIYEIWREAPIPGRKDRTPVSCTLTYHRPTKSFLRAVHNPFFYGGDPFFHGDFVTVNGSKKTLGLSGMLKQFQHALSTVYRQQIDNATIANTRFFLGKRNVVKAGTRVWPGRFLIVQDPDRDVKAVQMGDIYQSMHQLEIALTAWAEKRSGIADYQLGRESSIVGSRATATGTMAVLQEGNRRFDLNVRDMRQTFRDVGAFVLQLNQQFRRPGFAYFAQGEDGKWTEETLNLPREFLLTGLGVDLTATSAMVNRTTQQTGLISLLGILNQNLSLGQGVGMTLAHPDVPGSVKEYLGNAFKGIERITKAIAASYDRKDFDELVPVMATELGLGGMGMGGGPQGGPNGAFAGQNGANGSNGSFAGYQG